MKELIIFDNVVIKSYDDREYVLNFHIPTPSISLIIVPSLLDKHLIGKYISGYKKPIRGNIVYESIEIDKPGLFINDLIEDPNILIYRFLYDTLDSKDFSYIIRMLKSMGIHIDRDTVLSELPRPIRFFIGILYTLLISNNLVVLIEPFEGLDQKIMTTIKYEILRKRVNDSTIIIISSTKTYIDLLEYEYLVTIIGENEVYEGELRRFKRKNILENTTIYEVIGGKEILDRISTHKGFKGYFKVSKNTYWIFIDPRYRFRLLNVLKELTHERVIKRIKKVESGGRAIY